MVRATQLLLCCIWLIFLDGCREPFDVEVPAGSSLLVVSGMITDQPGPYVIKISRSTGLKSFEFPAESAAVVTLESQSGDSEILKEEEAGYYMTEDGGIQGQIGEQYRLTIVTKDEIAYESDWKLLKESPAIDSVYFEYKEQDIQDGVLQGLQTFVDTHDPNSKTEYYRFEWTETWAYNADLPAQFIYLGNDNRFSFPPKNHCWIDQPSTSISIASSLQNATDIISRHPILFVTTETPRLRVGYSLLVKQYALDQEEYLFWKTLKETANESGTLFDKQPQSITGNLHRVNSDEPVLGYFSASTIAEKRLFVQRSDLPEGIVVDATLSQLCFDGQVFIEKSATSEGEISKALDRGEIFYDWVVVPGIGITGYIFTTPICGDCTVQGGGTEKPEYWPI